MKRKLLLLLLVLMGTALLVGGCTTLPEPKGEDDTAFVLPVQRVQQSDGGSTFGYYEVHIGKAGDPSFDRTINVYAGSEMEMITGLEPGRYELSRYQFRYKNSNDYGSSREINAPFVLEPGALTICPTTVFITVFKKDPDASKNWMRVNFDTTSPPIRSRVLKELEEQESFSQWRVLSEKEAAGG
ncbi:MAG: hypothetical protein ACLFPW_02190 [Spirochaetaceae bacterium]